MCTYMCGGYRDCECIGIVGVCMCEVSRDCGCVHVWSV